MGENVYIDNPWIRHYTEQIDAAISAYLKAKAQDDGPGMGKALERIKTYGGHLKTRIAKIDKGKGNQRNTGGWNPPEAAAPPPKAVRKQEA